MTAAMHDIDYDPRDTDPWFRCSSCDEWTHEEQLADTDPFGSYCVTCVEEQNRQPYRDPDDPLYRWRCGDCEVALTHQPGDAAHQSHALTYTCDGCGAAWAIYTTANPAIHHFTQVGF